MHSRHTGRNVKREAIMTLEEQYSQYLKENSTSTYSFDEWKEKVFHPMLEKFMQQFRIHMDWEDDRLTDIE